GQFLTTRGSTESQASGHRNISRRNFAGAAWPSRNPLSSVSGSGGGCMTQTPSFSDGTLPEMASMHFHPYLTVNGNVLWVGTSDLMTRMLYASFHGTRLGRTSTWFMKTSCLSRASARLGTSFGGWWTPTLHSRWSWTSVA